MATQCYVRGWDAAGRRNAPHLAPQPNDVARVGGQPPTAWWRLAARGLPGRGGHPRGGRSVRGPCSGPGAPRLDDHPADGLPAGSGTRQSSDQIGPVTQRGPGRRDDRARDQASGRRTRPFGGSKKRTGESRRRACYSTTMSLPDTDTVPRPRGQTFVSILKLVPSPGIFAKICWGPRTICPFSTS